MHYLFLNSPMFRKININRVKQTKGELQKFWKSAKMEMHRGNATSPVLPINLSALIVGYFFEGVYDFLKGIAFSF